MGTVITGFIVFCFKRTVALLFFSFQTLLFFLFVKVCFIVNMIHHLYVKRLSFKGHLCDADRWKINQCAPPAWTKVTHVWPWRTTRGFTLVCIHKLLINNLLPLWKIPIRMRMSESNLAFVAWIQKPALPLCHCPVVRGKQVWNQVHFLRCFAN